MAQLSCERFVEQMGEYIEGRLSRGQELAMNTHRLRCRRCGELLSDYARLPGELRKATDVALPPGARARLARRLARRGKPTR